MLNKIIKKQKNINQSIKIKKGQYNQKIIVPLHDLITNVIYFHLEMSYITIIYFIELVKIVNCFFPGNSLKNQKIFSDFGKKLEKFVGFFEKN